MARVVLYGDMGEARRWVLVEIVHEKLPNRYVWGDYDLGPRHNITN